MTTYLVVAAQMEELEGLFGSLEDMQPIFNDPDVYFMPGENFSIYGMIGGIGKVSMALRLGLILNSLHVDEIINIGVAGSIDPKLKVLDTLIASSCCYHDVDVTAFGYQKGQMCACPLYFDCDKEAVKKALTFDKTCKTGLILSGDSFITIDNLPSSFYEDFDHPVACDMESAAVGQVALSMSIPFVIIRAISDDPTNNGNKEGYDAMLKEASRKAGQIAYYLISGKCQ